MVPGASTWTTLAHGGSPRILPISFWSHCFCGFAFQTSVPAKARVARTIIAELIKIALRIKISLTECSAKAPNVGRTLTTDGLGRKRIFGCQGLGWRGPRGPINALQAIDWILARFKMCAHEQLAHQTYGKKLNAKQT